MKTTRCGTLVAIGFLILILSAAASADFNDGLVAYYPFDGNADDASGNGHDGQVHGALLTPDRFGILASAYFFDGANADRIIIPNDPALSPAQLSLAVWIKPTESEHNSQLIVSNFSEIGSYSGYSLYFRYPDRRLGFQLVRARGDFNTLEVDFVPDGWHFVVATYDGQDMKLYVDGAPQGTTVNTLRAQ